MTLHQAVKEIGHTHSANALVCPVAFKLKEKVVTQRAINLMKFSGNQINI